MINSNEAYLLGLLYGKGTIDPVDDCNVILNFRVKFRRPTDQSLRADNIHTNILGRDYVESLKSKTIFHEKVIYLIIGVFSVCYRICTETND